MSAIIEIILNKISESESIHPKEKQALYEVWLKSGINKHQFAIKHKFPKSSIFSWFRQIEKNKKKEIKSLPQTKKTRPPQGWVPIITQEAEPLKKKRSTNKDISIEIQMPNHTIMRLLVEQEQAMTLIREVCHAN